MAFTGFWGPDHSSLSGNVVALPSHGHEATTSSDAGLLKGDAWWLWKTFALPYESLEVSICAVLLMNTGERLSQPLNAVPAFCRQDIF